MGIRVVVMVENVITRSENPRSIIHSLFMLSK